MAGVFAQMAARGIPMIPGLGGLASRLGGSTTPQAGTALRTAGGAVRNVAGLGLPGPLGSAARAFTGFTVGSAAVSGISSRLRGAEGGDAAGFLTGGSQGFQMDPRAAGGFGGEGLQGLLYAQGGIITKVWQPTPQSPVFAKLDYPGSSRRSKILFQRVDGTIGTYTPQRMIVLSRNPRVRDLSKAVKRIDTLTKQVAKAPTQTTRARKRVK